MDIQSVGFKFNKTLNRIIAHILKEDDMGNEGELILDYAVDIGDILRVTDIFEREELELVVNTLRDIEIGRQTQVAIYMDMSLVSRIKRTQNNEAMYCVIRGSEDDYITINYNTGEVNFARYYELTSNPTLITETGEGLSVFPLVRMGYELRPWQAYKKGFVYNLVPLFTNETYLKRLKDMFEVEGGLNSKLIENVYETSIDLQNLVMLEADLTVRFIELEDMYEAFPEAFRARDKVQLNRLRDTVEIPENVNLLAHYLVKMYQESKDVGV